ncbi:unnamed protein product [Ectocarpus sp. 12 AP-2014]
MSKADAVGDWSLFPDQETTTAQVRATPESGAGSHSNETSAATPGVAVRPQNSFNSPPVGEQGGDRLSLGRGKQNENKEVALLKSKAAPSPLRSGVHFKEDDDLEAAQGTPAPTTVGAMPGKAAKDEFELNEDRSPAEWMRVGDTTGDAFLWYTVILEIASACCSIVFIASHDEDQLSWKTDCWGRWTSLSDAEDVQFVEFDTHIGWQQYGKVDKLGLLSELSESTAVMGSLAGGMHGLVVIIACVFFFFSSSALWLSSFNFCCDRQTPTHEGKVGPKEGEQTKPTMRDHPLVLARDCHRWMFVMAASYILAGLWCFGVGCIGFYVVIMGDFTDGLQDTISGWGESVSCTEPQTSPRYGFFANGISILLFFGGGTIILYKTYVSDRELGEAVEMWKNDRAEMAEMEARLAMIRKKADYRAQVASAAASTASPVPIFKSRKSQNNSPSSFSPSPTTASGRNRHHANPSDLGDMLPLSPPDLVSLPSSAGTASAAEGWDGRHKRMATKAAFSPKGLEHDEQSVVSAANTPRDPRQSPSLALLESSLLQSPEPQVSNVDQDLELGSESAAAPVDEDLPPPPGWEVRTTPMGEKFWVNIATKNVSWDRPT